MVRRTESEVARVTPEVAGAELPISRERQGQGAVRTRTVRIWHSVGGERSGLHVPRRLFEVTPEQSARMTAEVEAMTIELVLDRLFEDSMDENGSFINDQPLVPEEGDNYMENAVRPDFSPLQRRGEEPRESPSVVPRNSPTGMRVFRASLGSTPESPPITIITLSPLSSLPSQEEGGNASELRGR